MLVEELIMGFLSLSQLYPAAMATKYKEKLWRMCWTVSSTIDKYLCESSDDQTIIYSGL